MQPTSTIPLRKTRDVGDVLNVTFQLIRQNVVPLGKSLLYIAAPLLVLSSIFGAMIPGNPFLVIDVESEQVNWAYLATIYTASAFFGMAGLTLATTVVYGFIMLYQDHGPDGFGVDDVWRLTRSFFFKFLGATLFLGLLFVLAAVIIIIPCLGALAYLVGAVYFGVVFSILLPMMMRERIGLFEAMNRCRLLVKDHWWTTFAVLLIAGLTYIILGTIFSMPAYIVSFLSGLHMADGAGIGPYRIWLILTSIISGIGATLTYSIPLIATAVQYFNLVERKERTGLMEQIDRLTPDADNETPPSSAFSSTPPEQ